MKRKLLARTRLLFKLSIATNVHTCAYVRVHVREYRKGGREETEVGKGEFLVESSSVRIFYRR